MDWLRGSPGAATILVRQVALISAPLTVSKVWLRTGGSSCTDYMSRTACKQLKASTPDWRAYFRGATVQAIAVSGDRAAATLSNDEIVQLRRIATGEWLIDTMGPLGAVGPDAAAQRRQHRGP